MNLYRTYDQFDDAALINSFNYYLELDQYQVNILRKLRDINVDYHHVGWYQSTYLSSHVTKEFLDSHVRYQRSIEESVVLIYGTVVRMYILAGV